MQREIDKYKQWETVGKKYTVPTNLWEQPIGNHHLEFLQSLWEQLFPQICRNSILGVPIENKHVKGGGLL